MSHPHQGPILPIRRTLSNHSLYSQHSNQSHSPPSPNALHQQHPQSNYKPAPIIVSNTGPPPHKQTTSFLPHHSHSNNIKQDLEAKAVKLPEIKQSKIQQHKTSIQSFANDAAQRHALFNQQQNIQSTWNKQQKQPQQSTEPPDRSTLRYFAGEQEAKRMMGTSQGSRWLRSQSLNVSREQKSFKHMIRHFHKHNSIMVEALNRFWHIFQQGEHYLAQSSYQLSLYDTLEVVKMKMESYLERRIHLENLDPQRPTSQWTQDMFITYYGKYRRLLQTDYQEESLHRPFVLKKYKNCVFFGYMNDGKKQHGILHYFNGKCFEGRFQQDQKQYGLQIDDNELYLGYFKRGVRNGEGILKTAQILLGGIFTDGQFTTERQQREQNVSVNLFDNSNKGFKQLSKSKKGFQITHPAWKVFLEGNALIKNNAGDLFIGILNDQGEKEGEGVQLFANGDIYIGRYEAGSPEGYGQYYWENGSYYRGQFLSGMRHGRGVWQMINGDSYEGEYMNDKKNGLGVYLWKNGSRYEGNFQNDYRHGYGEMKWQDGRVYKGKWLNGIQKNLLITLEKPARKNQKRAISNHRPSFKTIEHGNNRKIPLDKLKSLYNPSYQ